MEIMRKAWRVLALIVNRFFADDCANRAAALTYTTLLSIVPMMMVSFWVLSWFPWFKGTGERLQEFIVANFVGGSASVINIYLRDFMHQLTQLSIINLIFLILVGILMLFNMVQAFDEIWQVKKYYHYVLQFFIYLFILIFTPLLLGILMAVDSYLGSLSFISVFEQQSILGTILLASIPYWTAWIMFTLLNWLLPSCKVPFVNALIAGFLTMIAFELTKFFFGLYIAYFPTYKLLYGALATIPIFLAWVYLSWVIILIGAIICHELTVWQTQRREQRDNP